MRRMSIIVALLALGISFSPVYLTAREPIRLSSDPKLKLPQALALAQKHIKKNNVDTSKHYLDSIKLTLSSPWVTGEHWILVWKLKTPADGGEIFMSVDMNEKVRLHQRGPSSNPKKLHPEYRSLIHGARNR